MGDCALVASPVLAAIGPSGSFYRSPSGVRGLPDLQTTLWSSGPQDTVYEMEGFTSTLSQSVNVGSVTASLEGVTVDTDGNLHICDNSPGTGSAYKLDGFSSTVLETVLLTNGPSSGPEGISLDGSADMILAADDVDDLFKMDGFSSSLLATVDVSAITRKPEGISTDNAGDTLFASRTSGEIHKLLGFSTTETDSVVLDGGSDDPLGASWDGTNLLWCTVAVDHKLMRQVGFTTTIDEEIDVFASGVGFSPRGIEHGSFRERTGV